MSHFVPNPPDASALMTSARSFGSYDLASALADLIDNSITAQAKRISIQCLFNGGRPEVRLLDDGHGMTEPQLHAAMRPASTHPTVERAPDDLGRFGWGLKSASFSQCTRLTVISRRVGKISAARWDLNHIDGWAMEVLDKAESLALCSEALSKTDGTEVIWTNCDRLSENFTLDSAQFNELIASAANQLALIFHRYISGEVKGRKLAMSLNGLALPPRDPFYRSHSSTQPLEEDAVQLAEGGIIRLKAYVLPHFARLKSSEQDALAGEEGLLKNQGFYVYRNARLVIYGTWFRLVQYGELAQLIRIRLDIPNSLDRHWKLSLDKSDAQLPASLRTHLRAVVQKLKARSSRVIRNKGAQIVEAGPASVWQRIKRGEEVRYVISRSHPLVNALIESTLADSNTSRIVTAALSAIERSFPVMAFGNDVKDGIDYLHQTAANSEEFKGFLNVALPCLLAEVNGDAAALVSMLKKTEPFASHWAFVEAHLKTEEWISA
jgi:hypothetical protein